MRIRGLRTGTRNRGHVRTPWPRRTCPACPEADSIEMVDGEDVAERLDQFFADENAASKLPSRNRKSRGRCPGRRGNGPVRRTKGDALRHDRLEVGRVEDVVSGEDVSSRLQDIFETSAPPEAVQAPAPPETGVPTGLETDEELLPMRPPPSRAPSRHRNWLP